MKLYRCSPIENETKLLEAVRHIHVSCYALCKQSLGLYPRNAGNIGVFCHYDDEYDRLKSIREKLTEPSDNPNQKYFRLHEPITVVAIDDIPETTYTHLYIRKPDPYRYQVGDVDFYLEQDEYTALKQSLVDGKSIRGARVFDRVDLDMIELYDPDIDTLAYVSTDTESQKVRVKIT